jgi:DNA-binding GntR family transcriptional regulator
LGSQKLSAKTTARRAVSRPAISAARAKAAPDAADEQLSSSDLIVKQIIRGLYQGWYVPGQKLTESELARRYKVGRGSVREALQRLSAEGVVKVSLHKGATIRVLTRQEASDTIEVMEVLATLAARRAAERLSSQADIKMLRDMQKLFAGAKADPLSFEYASTRDKFYRVISHVSGNKELERLINTIVAHLIRVQFQKAYAADEMMTRVGEYGKVIQAILAKDPQTAERALRQHIRRTNNLVQTLSDDHFAE